MTVGHTRGVGLLPIHKAMQGTYFFFFFEKYAWYILIKTNV